MAQQQIRLNPSPDGIYNLVGNNIMNKEYKIMSGNDAIKKSSTRVEVSTGERKYTPLEF